jgi:hypothetical protein
MDLRRPVLAIICGGSPAPGTNGRTHPYPPYEFSHFHTRTHSHTSADTLKQTSTGGAHISIEFSQTINAIPICSRQEQMCASNTHHTHTHTHTYPHAKTIHNLLSESRSPTHPSLPDDAHVFINTHKAVICSVTLEALNQGAAVIGVPCTFRPHSTPFPHSTTRIIIARFLTHTAHDDTDHERVL